MKSAKPINPFSPLEIRKFVMPVSLATIFVFVGMVVEVFYSPTPFNKYLIAYGVLGVLYIVMCNVVLVRFSNIRPSHGTINSVLTGIGLGYLFLLLPDALAEVIHILIIFCAVAISTVSGRRYAYISLIGILAISLPENISSRR